MTTARGTEAIQPVVHIMDRTCYPPAGLGRLAFFRDLTARGLTGVALVTSDAHQGPVVAIGATPCPARHGNAVEPTTPRT